MTSNNIILVGFMGAGKTVIGKKLAQRLNLDFLDVDREIEKLLKLSIPLIFRKHGSIRFRSEEELMLTKIVRRQKQVIATGGGAILKESNRKVLKKIGTVVWLDASVEEIARRVGLGKGRPLLKGKDIKAVVSQLLAERNNLYQQVADLKILTDNKSIENITSEIIEKL